MTGDVRIREATPADRPAVSNVLDGALLSVTDGLLARAIDDGSVLVAVVGAPAQGTDERVLGALVLDGERIRAVAVRQRRRDQGIGSRLVAAADDRRDHLVAEFDPRVRPFWASLDFEITALDGENRYRGLR